MDSAAQNGLMINWKKCQFLEKRIDFLGIIVEDGCVPPSLAKLKAVKNFPLLESKKHKKKEAFKKLKTAACQKPVLRIHQPETITEVYTDASKEWYGAVLLRKRLGEDHFHPVYYMSRKTSDC